MFYQIYHQLATQLFVNILDKIVAQKQIEVAASKAQISRADLEKSPLFDRQGLSLKQKLVVSSQFVIPTKEESNTAVLDASFRQHDKIDITGIIAEFKRQSPSLGIINANVQVEVVTRGYADAGAAGLSVLTDTAFFGGSFQDFHQARAANSTTPMLRKDFMVDEYQLWEAKAMGADVILLIAACLSPEEINKLAQQAHILGMEVLLEVHDRQELESSLCQHIDLVGVNNRNLKTFVTNIETSVELSALIPDEFVKVSESGLKDVQTIQELRKIGYTGFLIGETFMKTPNPAGALAALSNELKQLSV